MWALAEAICKSLAAEADGNEELPRLARSILGSERDGISALLEELKFSPDHNFVLLVDQFEELFRYRRLGKDDAITALETESFVERLLHVFEQRPEGIYIITTMRSDYLGDCAQFAGLAEAINSSQYLVPRMKPKQIEEAIVRPPQLYGGEVEPELAAQIIRDMRGDQDNLPLMQHALLLMWVRALNGLTEAQAGETEAARIRLSLKVYDSPPVQDIYRALSIHGNEILNGLSPAQRRVAEIMFRRLTAIDDKREIRRPTRCGTLRQLAGVDLPELQAVVDAFRQPESSFIYANHEVLTDDTSLDISHESFSGSGTRSKIGWLRRPSRRGSTRTCATGSAEASSWKKAGLLTP
jgi:hypothetical protein